METFKAGLWKNIKNNNLYKTSEILMINATNNLNQTMVMYYPMKDPSTRYVREINEFLEKFIHVN